MRLLGTCVAMGLSLCTGGAARADEMYRWLDAAGGVHFGSEPPPGARAVEPWSPDGGRLRIEPQPGTASPAAPAAAPAAAEPVQDRIGGRSEAQWRQEALGLETRIRDLESELETLEESTQAYGGWATHRDKGLTRRVDVPDPRAALEKKLETAESQLDALEEEARRLGVPPGWLR